TNGNNNGTHATRDVRHNDNDNIRQPALACSICYNDPPKNAVKLSCGHLFCFFCIKGSYENGNYRCPYCRAQIDESFFNTTNVSVIGGTQIPTANSDGSYWFYEAGQPRTWWMYDADTTKVIERAYSTGTQFFEVFIAGFTYVIDFQQMIQYRKDGDTRKRAVRRDRPQALDDIRGVAGLMNDDIRTVLDNLHLHDSINMTSNIKSSALSESYRRKIAETNDWGNVDVQLDWYQYLASNSDGIGRTAFRRFINALLSESNINVSGNTFSNDQQLLLFVVFDRDHDGVLSFSEFSDLAKGWLKPIFNPTRALIVVDVQNDFINGSLALSQGPAKQDGADVVPVINDIIDKYKFDCFVYTLDWHTEDHISFFDNLQKRSHDTIEPSTDTCVKMFDTVSFHDGKTKQKLWPVHCVQDTWGAELHKDLKVVPNSIKIYKGSLPEIDSYSAFWDNSRQNETELASELRQANITDVYICGLATEHCVSSTAKDATRAGFMTFIVEDACRGLDESEIEKRKLELARDGVVFIRSDDLNQKPCISIDMLLKRALVYHHSRSPPRTASQYIAEGTEITILFLAITLVIAGDIMIGASATLRNAVRRTCSIIPNQLINMFLGYISVAYLLVALGANSVQCENIASENHNVTALTRTQQIELVSQSLSELIGELEAIKSVASQRLINVRTNKVSDDERIRQSKVSRFVLSKVSELEQESSSFKLDLERMFGLHHQSNKNSHAAAALLSPTNELIESGEQLIARLDEISKPEGRQESIAGVHQESVQLVDRLVQNYLSNLRRAINRITRFIDHRAPSTMKRTGDESTATDVNEHRVYKRQAIRDGIVAPNNGGDAQILVQDQFLGGVASVRQSILNRIQLLSKRMHEFTIQWTRMLGRQRSPLFDRIPPRGVELWRDFWDTVRKQVRRINQEFRQLTLDMTRLVTGGGKLQYAPETDAVSTNEVGGTYRDYYDKTNDAGVNNDASTSTNDQSFERINVIDELDDEFTRQELTRNPMLRQQIQQEIGVFGSIFDMMREFIRRLRESATSMIRDVIDPNSVPNNNNDLVTPGPDIKPQVDALLEETIQSQRHINSQAKPVFLPNDRVVG
ncbi:pncA, partial [Fragariocoptes setiger]